MKRILIMVFCLFLLAGCGGNTSKSGSVKSIKVTVIPRDKTQETKIYYVYDDSCFIINGSIRGSNISNFRANDIRTGYIQICGEYDIIAEDSVYTWNNKPEKQ